MTFVLKKFEDLKIGFEKTVRIMLDIKIEDQANELIVLDKLSKLSDTRKYEIQFLRSVLKEVEKLKIETTTTNNKQKPPIKDALKKNEDYCSSLVYGAMLLITKDIETNLQIGSTLEKSRLYKQLRLNMNLTKDNELSPTQLANCSKDINAFLSRIFLDNDSRNGFVSKYELQSVELNKLVSLITLSYKMEKDAHQVEIKNLAKEGTSTSKCPPFKIQIETPKAMVNLFESMEKLTNSFDNLSTKEQSQKGVSISPERKIQIEFLTKVIDYLSTMKPALKEADKIAIFAGMMYLIRGQIAANEYGYKPLCPVVNSTVYSSIVHTQLTEILNAKEESFENIEILITAANHFLYSLTIEPASEFKNVIKNSSIRAAHPFSKMEGFKLEEYLILAQNMIFDCRAGAIKQCKNEFKKIEDARKKEEDMLKPKDKSSKGYFSFFPKSNAGAIETGDISELYDQYETDDKSKATEDATITI